LDVEQHDVRFVPLYGGQRLQAIGRLRYDLGGSDLFQLVTQLVTGELLVVDNDYPHGSLLVAGEFMP